MSFGFEVAVRSGGRARTGMVHTPHGDICTPAFIPAGTKVSVKAVLPEATADLSTRALLANAYHLYLQPGSDLVDEAGGLGCFMSWPDPTLMGSSGSQMISLGIGFKKVLAMDTKGSMGDNVTAEGETRRTHVDEDGITFLNHLNGDRFRFTLEISMTIQHQLGANIMFAFDELITLMNTRNYQEVPVACTRRWVVRCLRAHATLTEERAGKPHQALFRVVRGVQYEDLRRRATMDLAALEVDGFRFNGFGLGKVLEGENLGHIIGWMVGELPENRPRHLFGVFELEGLFEAMAFGVDISDCVNPSKVARNAAIYTADGRYSMNTTRDHRVSEPLEAGYDCYICTHYTRAYLHHLFKVKEMLAFTSATIHNECFTVRLVDEIRASLESGGFGLLRNEFMGRYNARKTQ